MARQRSKKNKNVRAGTANCQWGLWKKGNDLFETYNVDVVIVTRRPDGFMGGFQSRPGLMQDFFKTLEEADLMSPHQFKDKKHRSLNTFRRSSSPSSQESSPSSIASSECESSNSQELALATEPTALLQPPHLWDGGNLTESAEQDMLLFGDLASTFDLFPLGLTCEGENLSTVATEEVVAPCEELERKEGSPILQPSPVSGSTRRAIISLLDAFL
ncbi:hypothetical protein HIM_09205 [Hirsutella minnesotensis 3608]|uniref:MADS-box domain-containing protein n=1 Tax=Hirsutella minnesotensis 3608 TaxID=1043627 RepID=A0A0F7ZXW2_9HYPO|nr:hypothetical protein HIM_09205 [Hirsutella minnesotensis 3608]